MVSGIDSDGLDNLSKKVKQYYLDLSENISDLRNEFEQINNSCEGFELKSVYNRFDEQFKQLYKINNKIENYYQTLDNIILGYKEQEHYIADITNLYLNKED